MPYDRSRRQLQGIEMLATILFCITFLILWQKLSVRESCRRTQVLSIGETIFCNILAPLREREHHLKDSITDIQTL